MVLEFVKSQKGEDMLLEGGYLFEKDKTTDDGRVFWKCIEVKKGKCPARRHTLQNEIVKSVKQHNHVPDVAAIEARKTLLSIKERAKVTRDAGYAVISEGVSGLADPIQAKLPNIECMKRTIRRQRQVQGHYPANPNSLRELNVPEDISRISVNGEEEQFLLYDNGVANDNRILIFGTQRNLEMLGSSDHWYADGTFKTTPPLFSQVYTIHGVKFNNCIPSVFVLLTGKTELIYQQMIQALKDLKPNLQPITIMMDFERAAMNAFETEFPGVSIRGCFFHLSQCIWRKVQENGKAARYANDAVFALQVKMLTALAFLPTEDVIPGFEELTDSQNYINDGDLQSISDYFEDVWIGRLNRRFRRPPLFPPILWNCHEATENDLPRTNNSVEGWHRRFTELVSAEHPSIWKFIDSIKKEQHMNEVVITQFIQGRDGPPQKKVYRDINVRIKNCMARYDANDKITFLRGIAYNLNLNV